MEKIFFPKNLLSFIRKIYILFVSFFVSGCSSYFYPEFKEVKKSEIISIDSANCDVRLIVGIKNKCFFDYDLKKLEFYAIAQNDTLGKFYANELITLPSKKDTNIVLQAKFSLDKIARVLREKSDTLDLKLLGSAIANLFMFDIKADINMPFKFSWKDLLYKELEKKSEKLFRVIQVKLDRLGIQKTNLVVNFEVYNPYAIRLKIVDFPNAVYINDVKVGEGFLKESFELNKEGSRIESYFIYETNNINVIISAAGIFFKRKIEYLIDGTLVVELFDYRIKLPYKIRGEVL